MKQISHILVVVDPSGKGRQSAVDKATILAQHLGACVELLICDIASAIRDRVIPLHAEETPSSNSNTRLLGILDELAAPTRAAGVDVKTRLIYGNSLHDALLDYIRGSNAGLVIKDTHHHTFAKRTFLGNTDWHLARGCAVPLLLTKKQTWMQPPIIMAAVDPTHVNERAAALDRHILYCAASLAGRLRADLHVTHTFVPTAFANAVAAGNVRMSPEYCEALQIESNYRYHEIEHLVSQFGVSPEHLHVEMGTPLSGLVKTATQHRTDILVMGASAHGRWHRSVVGSTAATVLESLPCDFLIVRPCDELQGVPL
jgi:universal stress protein E